LKPIESVTAPKESVTAESVPKANRQDDLLSDEQTATSS
jgi:hypothetical protein